MNILIDPEQVHDICGGYEGENGVTVVSFDLSAWISRYGAGNVYIDAERPGGTKVQIPLELTGSLASWTLSEDDTAAGTTALQVVYSVDGKTIRKSGIFRMNVSRSLD